MASVGGAPNKPETFHAPAQGGTDSGISGYFRGILGMGTSHTSETKSIPIPEKPDPSTAAGVEATSPQTEDWTFGLFRRPSSDEASTSSGGMTRNQTWSGFSLFGSSQEQENPTNQKPLKSSASSHHLGTLSDYLQGDSHEVDSSQVDGKHGKEDEKVSFSLFTSDSEPMAATSSRSREGSASPTASPSTVSLGAPTGSGGGQRSAILSAYNQELKRGTPRHVGTPLGGIAEQPDGSPVKESVGRSVGLGSELSAKDLELSHHHRRHLFDKTHLNVNRKEMNLFAPTST